MKEFYLPHHIVTLLYLYYYGNYDCCHHHRNFCYCRYCMPLYPNHIITCNIIPSLYLNLSLFIIPFYCPTICARFHVTFPPEFIVLRQAVHLFFLLSAADLSRRKRNNIHNNLYMIVKYQNTMIHHIIHHIIFHV